MFVGKRYKEAMSTALPKTFFDIQTAMKAAKARTGDETLASRVKAGKFQIMSVTFKENGVGVEKPLSEWMSGEKLIETLNAMKVPTIGMGDFFNLPQIKAAQKQQASNPYGSAAHRAAHDTMVAEATKYGAQAFFGEY